VSAQFARGGFHESSDGLRFFPDLDHGVEWCEDEVIAGASTAAPTRTDLAAQLSAIVGGQYDFEKLLSYLHRRDYAADEYLIRQGDEQDMVFFIESGQVTAQLETPNRPPVRLETLGSGRAVGELGFYLEIERTAAVVVDEPSVIYALSRRELAAMEMIDPETSNLFHRIIVRLLGERVVHLIRVVEALEH
jgi:SulP family sulfate permease